MAQGGLKKKSEKFSFVSKSAKEKSVKHSKPLGPKKGGHYIAPKKAGKVKAEKLKKQFQKQIGQRIEQEVTQRATKGGTEFRILNNPQTSAKSETQSGKNKKGKKL